MLRPIKRFEGLARILDAKRSCIESGNQVWEDTWDKRIDEYMDSAPSGSGWDEGTKLGEWNGRTIVFFGSFHHMDEGGGYDGWTEHIIRAKPSLAYGFDLSVSGKNRNQIKDYLAEMFSIWLDEEVDKM
tara:strand:+ start:209 stop:595 length:387 start_codon:yes stop_codon:yes gene_type:complete